jgi:hypothetical protein
MVNAVMKKNIISAVLGKFRKEKSFSLNCHDGRVIDVDYFTDGSGYAVSVWETVGYYWDSDYKQRMPAHGMINQKKCGTKQAVAEYISELF